MREWVKERVGRSIGAWMFVSMLITTTLTFVTVSGSFSKCPKTIFLEWRLVPDTKILVSESPPSPSPPSPSCVQGQGGIFARNICSGSFITSECLCIILALTHSLTHSPTHPLTHPSTHSLTHSSTHPLTHPSTHSLTYSSTHPLTHPSTHSLTHLPTH